MISSLEGLGNVGFCLNSMMEGCIKDLHLFVYAQCTPDNAQINNPLDKINPMTAAKKPLFTRLPELLQAFNELVMFKHTVFSLPFIFVAMVTGADGWFGWRLLGLGLLAAVSARNFAMGVNRYLDRDIDAANPRTAGRPSVDGRISPAGVLAFSLANAALFIWTAWMVNDLAFQLAMPILIVLGGYSVFKRFSAAAHLVLGLSLGLAPVAGAVAVTGTVPLWSVVLAAGVMFWVAGFDLLYSLQDMAFDKEKGLFSVPSRYGAAFTMNLSRVFHLLTVAFWAGYVHLAGLGNIAWAGVGLAALMLAYEHRIVMKDFTKIDRAFFTVNGYLGIFFFILIVLDVAWK